MKPKNEKYFSETEWIERMSQFALDNPFTDKSNQSKYFHYLKNQSGLFDYGIGLFITQLESANHQWCWVVSICLLNRVNRKVVNPQLVGKTTRRKCHEMIKEIYQNIGNLNGSRISESIQGFGESRILMDYELALLQK